MEPGRRTAEATSPNSPKLISSHSRSHSLGSDSSDERNLVEDPATFNFPTLNLDGSLPDLSSTPRYRYYEPTPPAALSTLGIRARMENPQYSSEPFSDSQYDMIDDAPEFANDDDTAETASLPSTEQDEGQLTPDEANSTVDTQEEQETVTEGSVTLGGESYETIRADGLTSVEVEKIKQMHADNAVMDSIDELKTPTRSFTFASSSSEETPSSPSHSSNRLLRVLFVSEKGVDDEDISEVCHRIASCLAGKDYSMTESVTRLVRLPPTPTGINPSRALFLSTGNVEMIIEHCVGAEPRNSSPDSYGLRIQDADKEHTSVFTLGSDGKIDLEVPDIAIFYLSQPSSYPVWFSTVKRAMKARSVPSMTIVGPSLSYASLTEAQKKDAMETDLFFLDEEFYDADDGAMRVRIEDVLHNGPRSQRFNENKKTEKRSPKTSKGYWILVISCLLAIVMNHCMPFLGSAQVSVAADLDIRREALSTALFRMTNSSDATKVYNIDHLLPHPDDFKDSNADLIPPHVRHQGAPPNHIILSLPRTRTGNHHFPEVVEAHVYKVNGQELKFNLTKLIDGVYDVTIPTSSASGNVGIHMITKKPATSFHLQHNFGNKMLQRKTYEKASTDLTNTVNKEVAVARKNARSLGSKMGHKIGLELGASAAATKNVTTEIALYMLRELQVLGNTGVSVFGKAAKASNVTAASVKKELMTVQKDLISLGKEVKKDLIVAQKDIVNFSKGVHKSLSTTAKTAKAMIPSVRKSFKHPLALSRNRALGLKALLHRKKEAASHKPAMKALSNRVNSIFKPFEMPDKKPMGFWEVQRCLYTYGAKACKERQKMLKASASEDEIVAAATAPEKHSSRMASKLARKCAGKKKAAEERKSLRKVDREAREMRAQSKALLAQIEQETRAVKKDRAE